MGTLPRIVIGAPASGHGKTAVAVGLLAAIRARGVRPAAFKIGPDFVDAAYLGYAAGSPGRNLDPQLVGAGRLGPLLLHGSAGRELAVVEGTMGLFDGLAGRVDSESTAQVAGLLRAPVILVVDVATMGQSVAALVHGFRGYDELLWLGGVILNRVGSDRHEQVLRESLADLGVPVLGALRRGQLTGGALPPRSAGVVPVLHGTVEATRAVRRLGEAIAANVDVDRIMALARSAPALVAEAWSPEPPVAPGPGLVAPGPVPVAPGPVPGGSPAGPAPAGPGGGRLPVIAVAGTGYGDYGYAEARELLAAAGAEIVTVDPLRDNGLPAGVEGLVLGGGLPEGYLEEVSANTPFLRSVAALAATGAPVVAEAAGLALLSREHNGRPMAGVLPTATRLGEHLVLGYREATARSASVLFPAGARVWGYKQHTGQAVPRAGAAAAWLWPGGALEGFVQAGVHASFLTTHWAGTPGIAPRLLAAARRLRPAEPRPLEPRPLETRPLETRPAEPVEPRVLAPTMVERVLPAAAAEPVAPVAAPIAPEPATPVSPAPVPAGPTGLTAPAGLIAPAGTTVREPASSGPVALDEDPPTARLVPVGPDAPAADSAPGDEVPGSGAPAGGAAPPPEAAASGASEAGQAAADADDPDSDPTDPNGFPSSPRWSPTPPDGPEQAAA